MTTRDKLATLIGRAFSNQRELQNKLRPDWADQHDWRYYRAIWTEIAEAIGHTNWYWWKTGQFNQPMTPLQVAELDIELCDIFHFGLTMDIYKWIHGGRPEAQRVLDYVDAFEDAAQTPEPLDVALEGIVVDAILLHEFNIKKFARACGANGMDLTTLLVYYFSKSALNQFRWDNGYNNKTYVKMWKLPTRIEAVEDNTVLAEMIAGLLRQNSPSELVDAMLDEELTKGLYGKLQHMYRTLVTQ